MQMFVDCLGHFFNTVFLRSNAVILYSRLWIVHVCMRWGRWCCSVSKSSQLSLFSPRPSQSSIDLWGSLKVLRAANPAQKQQILETIPMTRQNSTFLTINSPLYVKTTEATLLTCLKVKKQQAVL